MKKTYLTISLCVLMASTSVHANKAGDVYAGVSFGKMELSDTARGDFDDTAFKFIGGYQINDLVAIEGHYASLDTNDRGFNAETTSLGVSGVFTPIRTHKIVPFGKIGFGKVDGEVTSPFERFEGDETGITFGVGAMMPLAKNFNVRAEYEKFNSDVDMFSIGASYAF